MRQEIWDRLGLYRQQEQQQSVEKQEYVIDQLVHGILIPLGLLALATLGSTVLAAIAAVLELVRSISTATTGVLTATFLSAWCCAYSFSIYAKVLISKQRHR